MSFSISAQRSWFFFFFQPELRVCTIRLESIKKFIWIAGSLSRPYFLWRYSRDPMTAIISILLFVVSGSFPLIAVSLPSSVMIAAHPPGPGFPKQLPSV